MAIFSDTDWFDPRLRAEMGRAVLGGVDGRGMMRPGPSGALEGICIFEGDRSVGRFRAIYKPGGRAGFVGELWRDGRKTETTQAVRFGDVAAEGDLLAATFYAAPWNEAGAPAHGVLGDLQELTRGIATVVAAYRRRLEDGGMPDNEAWALAQRLEERLLGPLYDQAEAELAPAPWADIEALFVAVINLQLVLGQPPDADGAVQYMRSAGVKLPTEISDERCLELARRASIDPEEVRTAFG